MPLNMAVLGLLLFFFSVPVSIRWSISDYMRHKRTFCQDFKSNSVSDTEYWYIEIFPNIIYNLSIMHLFYVKRESWKLFLGLQVSWQFNVWTV
jgi:hypothetical protein